MMMMNMMTMVKMMTDMMAMMTTMMITRPPALPHTSELSWRVCSSWLRPYSSLPLFMMTAIIIITPSHIGWLCYPTYVSAISSRKSSPGNGAQCLSGCIMILSAVRPEKRQKKALHTCYPTTHVLCTISCRNDA